MKPTAIRYEQARAETARQRFYSHPESISEAIAAHYTAHAVMALQLLQLCKQRRELMPDQFAAHLDQFIEYLTNQIRNNHFHDFGISLDWTPPA